MTNWALALALLFCFICTVLVVSIEREVSVPSAIRCPIESSKPYPLPGAALFLSAGPRGCKKPLRHKGFASIACIY